MKLGLKERLGFGSGSRWLLAAVLVLVPSTQSFAGSIEAENRTQEVPSVLISTDIATGLVDTHGAQGSCPVTYSQSDLATMHDADFTPQDIDDGLTVALALNLEPKGLVRVDSVIPTFGNATLPAEMLVARQIVWNLKGRTDLPLVPGAIAQAGQVLHPAPEWFDGTPLSVEESFAASCKNAGVELMHSRLTESVAPLTVLATGPLTDVACLLMNHPEVAPKIREVIVLASRVEGESLTINGLVVNDFNFRMDPLGGALFLNAARRVPVRLMTFALSGQTSQEGDRLIVFDSSTLEGPYPPTPRSEKSLAWLLGAADVRNTFWEAIFGTPEGPFDQYTLVAAIQPELFDCRPGLAYIQQCPYPAWSPDFPADSSGTPTEEPYNHEPNPCVDHGTMNGATLSQIAAELVVSLDVSKQGPLVRGTTGVDGNLPQLGPALPVTACVDFASDEAFVAFRDLLYEHTW